MPPFGEMTGSAWNSSGPLYHNAIQWGLIQFFNLIFFMKQDLKLVTIKKAHEVTGVSRSFFRKLISENKLTRYKIHSATYVSLVEFENLAQPGPASESKRRVELRKAA